MADTLVWITGASSGIGTALAATVPFDDAHIFDISRSGGTPGTEHVPADLSDPAAWAAVEAHLHAQLAAFTGRRAVFLHCAGTLQPIGFAGEVDSAAYRRNVVLNSAAGQALGHAFLAASAAGGAGQRYARYLVFLSSGAAKTPYEGWSSYCASKAAVDQWVRVVGAEQQRRPGACQVLAVSPGVVATKMQEQIRETDEADFPEVAKFQDLFETGALKDPRDAALDIWALLARDLPSGSVVDLRTLDS
jgi:NAD(P)-dependent dehydrogenase (short-subunit alcohol dehydrogenase family)